MTTIDQVAEQTPVAAAISAATTTETSTLVTPAPVALDARAHVSGLVVGGVLAAASVVLASIIPTPALGLWSQSAGQAEPLVLLSAAVGLPAFALGYLGVLDMRTHLVRNHHNAALLGLAGIALPLAGLLGAAPWAAVGVAAAVGAMVFVTLLAMALLPGGAIGGGDLKLLPTVAMLLALHSPVGGFVWVLLTLVLTVAALVVMRLRGAGKDTGVPMVPIGALCLLLTLAALIPVQSALTL